VHLKLYRLSSSTGGLPRFELPVEFTSLWGKKKKNTQIIADVLFPLSLALYSRYVTGMIPHLIIASESKFVYSNTKGNFRLYVFQSLERKPHSLLKYKTHYRKC
jgi:hypothetical protein